MGGGSENGDSSVGLFAGSEGLARAVSLLDVECRQVDAEADSSAEGDALVGLGRGHGVGAVLVEKLISPRFPRSIDCV